MKRKINLFTISFLLVLFLIIQGLIVTQVYLYGFNKGKYQDADFLVKVTKPCKEKKGRINHEH